MTLGRLVIKALGNAKGRSGTGDEVPGRLVDLDYGAGTHEQLSVKFALAGAASAGPAVQGREGAWRHLSIESLAGSPGGAGRSRRWELDPRRRETPDG